MDLSCCLHLKLHALYFRVSADCHLLFRLKVKVMVLCLIANGHQMARVLPRLTLMDFFFILALAQMTDTRRQAMHKIASLIVCVCMHACVRLPACLLSCMCVCVCVHMNEKSNVSLFMIEL